MNLTDQPWFGWTLGIIVVVPVLTVLLSEVHLQLVRRRNPLARTVNRLRIWLLPLTALLVLLTQAGDLTREDNGVRLVATLVGMVAVSVALSGLNAMLFGSAAEGSWRDRLPSIFVDLARLVLVVAGAAVVASFVWGLDVGGLFAALGVGSIVIGLALQNGVGSVVSGLLLLFEQPFQIGDTLTVAGTTGRVVEVNWRSTHLDTGSAEQVIPNAVIAGTSFANLSRPTPAHDLVVETTFTAGDTPHDVLATLLSVARDLPFLRPGDQPTASVLGGGVYAVRIPLETAADAAAARSQFLTWLWYTARREGLALDGAAAPPPESEQLIPTLARLTATLSLGDDDVHALAAVAEVDTFGRGEHLVRPGARHDGLRYVVEGLAREEVVTGSGQRVLVADYGAGEVVGAESVMREPSQTDCTAVTTVVALTLPVEAVDQIVANRPDVARRLNDLVALRASQRRAALTQAEPEAVRPTR